MKKLIFCSFFLLISLLTYAQESVKLQFEIIERASPLLGAAWDFEYMPVSTMRCSFDGKYLDVRYKNGKYYLNEDVNKWEIVKIYDSDNKNKLKSKNYILTICKEGKEFYYVIEYLNVNNSYLKVLHIPRISKSFIISGYTILRSNFIAGNIN